MSKYGGDNIIHKSTNLGIEIAPDGHVAVVWFRCRPIAFEEYRVDYARAAEMRDMYSNAVDKTAFEIIGIIDDKEEFDVINDVESEAEGSLDVERVLKDFS